MWIGPEGIVKDQVLSQDDNQNNFVRRPGVNLLDDPLLPYSINPRYLELVKKLDIGEVILIHTSVAGSPDTAELWYGCCDICIFFTLTRISLLKLVHCEQTTHLSNLKVCVSPDRNTNLILKNQQSAVVFEREYFREYLIIVDTSSESIFEISRRSTSILRFGFGVVEAAGRTGSHHEQVTLRMMDGAEKTLRYIHSHGPDSISGCVSEFLRVQFGNPN